MSTKLKVVWLCHLSNSKIRRHLPLRQRYMDNLFNKIFKRGELCYTDYAQWMSNGIDEEIKLSDIELHVVAPFLGLKPQKYEFVLHGVYYHFYRSEDDYFWYRILTILKVKSRFPKYIKNRALVKKIISSINPDIVHLFGAENPYYSICALDVNTKEIPLIVSMQTALTAPDFLDKYPMSKSVYNYKSTIEKEVLAKASFVCASNQMFRDTVWNYINPKAIFTRCTLALGETITEANYETTYDFVYFALNISKAFDLALDAFSICSRMHPGISLLVIGAYTRPYKQEIDEILIKQGIADKVVFTGQLPTHDDVLSMIKKSRFALLPLKVDTVSGTVREAMASSIPVVTTITSGTPMLNNTRESVLLSEIGDAEAMALNMVKLLDTPSLADSLKRNALITFKENWSNETIVSHLNHIYKCVMKNITENKEIEDSIFTCRN